MRTGVAEKEGQGGLRPCEKKFWRGLVPLKLFNSIIRDTLIEQSRSRYSNRAVTVFFEEQCSKLQIMTFFLVFDIQRGNGIIILDPQPP